MNGKKLAGEAAVEYVEDGMLLGLGTGTTVYWSILKLSELIKNGLQILRKDKEVPFITDNGNYILDCRFTTINEPEELNTQLNMIPGVVENGLFVRMADTVVVGGKSGTEIRTIIDSSQFNEA